MTPELTLWLVGMIAFVAFIYWVAYWIAEHWR